MKNYIFIAIVLLALGISACGKSGGAPAPAPPPRNPDSLDAMTATINTVAWAADTISGFLIPIGNDSGRYNLSISGKNNSNSVMILYISNYTGIGQYNINPPNVSATYYQGAIRHYSISGQVNITNDSTADLQGTFNFVADSALGLNATSGVFRFSL